MHAAWREGRVDGHVHEGRHSFGFLPAGEILKLLPHGGLKSEIETAAAAVRKINEEVNTKTRGFAEGARLIELHVELGGKLPALLAPTRTLLLELTHALHGS